MTPNTRKAGFVLLLSILGMLARRERRTDPRRYTS